MKHCVAIVGPTGIGKTALAIELATRLDGEIVNADALQVYRGLDVGTSKPSAEDRERVPHHLVDILDPAERFSAGEFARRASDAIVDIRSRDRLPFVVGGSGFYFRALFEGLSPIPEVDEEVRLRLDLEGSTRVGLDALWEELTAADPTTAERLSPNDGQRILRALAVFQSSGKPLSEWQRKRRRSLELEVSKVGLTLPRDVLYDRLASRAHAMLGSGWVEEVQELRMGGIEDTWPAFQAIGYRELSAYLRKECTLEEAEFAIVQGTRRYAKRQWTWFRSEPGIRWFEGEDPSRLRDDVLDHLRAEGLAA